MITISRPGGSLMEVVPLEDKLLIEARISRRDIAFIRPRLPATVKITAYDPSIYGTVGRISPDTLQDEVNRDRSSTASMSAPGIPARGPGTAGTTPSCRAWPATVEIRTGRKTVFDYLMKPINKAKEAMRERKGKGIAKRRGGMPIPAISGPSSN
ncbi:HlyD family efflux transporter periplasmic adaptor subunit [Sphingobium indicum]|uniref:AprE-like beta-barrel domain-containing protein n=1 Tax=Sphingobium indicum F2 TaxID=1450518 RepID=A0A8E0WN95_9SPHN|nr:MULTISPECIES: HlyD family efflux transporter periplasmic adaptor subunit [Sphingobium]KER34379.1 hypothetical protein AL00_21855 [Sphingobium indicum F2]